MATSSLSQSHVQGSEYHLITSNGQNHTEEEDRNSTLSQFKWLDPLIIYSPSLVFKLPPNYRRWKLWTIALIIFVVFGMFMSVVGDFWITGQHWREYTIFAKVFLLIRGILKFCKRILSLIYFLYYFNYPWHSHANLDEISHDKEQGCNWISYITRNYNSILKILFGTILISLSISWTCAALYIQSIDTLSIVESIIFNGILYTFCAIPLQFPLFIHCIICYKYYCYLEQLIESMDGMNSNLDDIEYGNILLKYKKIRDLFKIDYNSYLKWIVILIIAEGMFEIWVGGIDPAFNPPSHSKGRMIIFVLISIAEGFITISVGCAYIMSSTVLSETFDEFIHILWRMKMKCIEKEKYHKNMPLITSIIVFAKEYPIRIDIFGVIMTRINIIYVAVAFGAAKLAAFMSVIYYENIQT